MKFKGVVDGAKKKPKGPQIFKSKFEDEIRHQHENPHQKKFGVQKGTERVNRLVARRVKLEGITNR